VVVRNDDGKQALGTDPDGFDFETVSDFDMLEQGRIVHLKDYNPVKAFMTAREDSEPQYWATDDLVIGKRNRLTMPSANIEGVPERVMYVEISLDTTFPRT